MRKHGLSFLAPALAGVLGVVPACLLDLPNNDDDDGADTGNGTECADDDGSGSGTAAEGSGTAVDGTASESTAADDTAGTGTCGWGPTGDPAVPEGYVCGGEGEDPSGMLPMLCPDTVDLQTGGACNGIEGQGCCDVQGNAWFCGDAGRGPALARIEC